MLAGRACAAVAAGRRALRARGGKIASSAVAAGRRPGSARGSRISTDDSELERSGKGDSFRKLFFFGGEIDEIAFRSETSHIL